jgi:prephenate dehydrogenase
VSQDFSATPFWQTIAVVGVGLIGGSVGLAARRRGVCERAIGVGRSLEKLQTAIDLGAIDEATTTLEDAARRADLIVICTPVESIADFALQAAAHCRPVTLITDAGSTKGEIVARIDAGLSKAELAPSGAAFVGAHPLAGGENQGVEFADAELFAGRQTIVTPSFHSPSQAVAAIEGFWKRLGANVLTMSPEEHDRAVAAISHLPHLVAAALAGSTPEKYLSHAARGWSDATRIAAGDAELWRQIFSQNRENLLASLEVFERAISEYRRAIDANDGETLIRLLEAGKHARDIARAYDTAHDIVPDHDTVGS